MSSRYIRGRVELEFESRPVRRPAVSTSSRFSGIKAHMDLGPMQRRQQLRRPKLTPKGPNYEPLLTCFCQWAISWLYAPKVQPYFES